MSDTGQPPLIRWDGAHLALDLGGAARWIQERVPGGLLRDLELSGEGEAVRLAVTVQWAGVPSRVAVDLTELRLRRGVVGCRVGRLRVLGGVPLPRVALATVLERLRLRRVRVFRNQGIVVVDLRGRLPGSLDLGVITVQATQETLHLWLGPGSLRLPPPARN